jgi:hypothetical protein
MLLKPSKLLPMLSTLLHTDVETPLLKLTTMLEKSKELLQVF